MLFSFSLTIYAKFYDNYTASILPHVSVTIFGHHQVVLIQSLSVLSPIPPPLANVYNWGKVVLSLTM
jgi:hypothetical protein